MGHEEGVSTLLWLWGAEKCSGQLTALVENAGFLTALKICDCPLLGGKSTKQELCISCLQTSQLSSEAPLGVSEVAQLSCREREGKC